MLSKQTSHSHFSVATALVPDILQCTAQVEELLHPFGLLKAFNLVMDKHTGNSKARSCYQPPPTSPPCGLYACVLGRLSSWLVRGMR